MATGALITMASYYFFGYTKFVLHKDLIQLVTLSIGLIVVLALTKSLSLLWQFFNQKTVIKPTHIYILLAFIGIHLLLDYFIKESSYPAGETTAVKMMQMFLIIPVLEELVFKGVFQARLSKKYQWSTSILVPSLLFMLIHYGAIDQMVLAFLFSLFAGYLFYRTSSLLFCIIYHIAMNVRIYLLATF